MPESDIADLQSRLTYLNHTIDELSDVVTKQVKRIDRLNALVEELLDREMARLAQDAGPEAPPPHY